MTGLREKDGHTPGPWGLQECYQGGAIVLRGDPMGHPQSHVQIVPEADARLIAAAPDLLDALRSISDMLMARPDIVKKLHPMMGPAEHAVFTKVANTLAKALPSPLTHRGSHE